MNIDYMQELSEDMQRWREYKESGIGVEHDVVSHWLNAIGTKDEYVLCTSITTSAPPLDQ